MVVKIVFRAVNTLFLCGVFSLLAMEKNDKANDETQDKLSKFRSERLKRTIEIINNQGEKREITMIRESKKGYIERYNVWKNCFDQKQ